MVSVVGLSRRASHSARSRAGGSLTSARGRMRARANATHTSSHVHTNTHKYECTQVQKYTRTRKFIHKLGPARARTHTHSNAVHIQAGGGGGGYSDSSADVTGCTRARRARTPPVCSPPHPPRATVPSSTSPPPLPRIYIYMFLQYACARDAVRMCGTMWWRQRRRWCCWTTTSTPPRQSARPFRRLVGVDKVSHRGRHLTTNSERSATAALTALYALYPWWCAQWPHRYITLAASATYGRRNIKKKPIHVQARVYV